MNISVDVEALPFLRLLSFSLSYLSLSLLVAMFKNGCLSIYTLNETIFFK